MHFGRRNSAGQFHLFNEAEILAATIPYAEVQDVVPLSAPISTQPARGKRSPLPPELERIEIIHDVPESKHFCDCGTPMVVINRVVSEQLDIIPMQVRVLQHIRLVYGCEESCHAPVTAKLPQQPLPKSNASPGLLAMLLTTKYVDGLPLARFEKVLAVRSNSSKSGGLKSRLGSCPYTPVAPGARRRGNTGS